MKWVGTSTRTADRDGFAGVLAKQVVCVTLGLMSKQGMIVSQEVVGEEISIQERVSRR
jgi:hypothetical protein